MDRGILHLDQSIRHRLEAFTVGQKDYWAFRDGASRKYSQPYFQYPAMMVPYMQGDLLRSVVDGGGRVKRVFDPFADSGTVLTEVMLLGLDFAGQDINPLAVLLCKAKRGPFYAGQLRSKTAKLFARIHSDKDSKIEADFPGIKKWFTPCAAAELSRIRRGIRAEQVLWA